MKPQLYEDKYKLGQASEARRALQSAGEEMAETWWPAFRRAYCDEQWRAMNRRRFYQARVEHDRAKGVLSWIGETV